MRKILLIISLLAILLIAASSAYTKLYRLTIINKSGMDMAISLLGEDDNNQYYLRVPAGDRRSPTETIFTLVPDTYSINAYYIEPWDPVYGYTCNDPGGKTLVAERNIRLTFTECNYTPRNGGEPSMWKFNARRVREFN
jgi:hypothetical protein